MTYVTDTTSGSFLQDKVSGTHHREETLCVWGVCVCVCVWVWDSKSLSEWLNTIIGYTYSDTIRILYYYLVVGNLLTYLLYKHLIWDYMYMYTLHHMTL